MTNLHKRFVGIQQIEQRLGPVTRHFYTSSRLHDWYCRKSSTPSQRRHGSSFGTKRSYEVNGGGKRWKVIAIGARFTTPWLMEKQLMKEGLNVSFDTLGIPFGAEIMYKPINPKNDARTPEFGAKMPRGGKKWNGNMIVADLDGIENCNSISDIHIKSFKSKEVIVIKDQDYIVFRVLLVPSNSRDNLFLVTIAVCLFPVKEMTQRAISRKTKKTPKPLTCSMHFKRVHIESSCCSSQQTLCS